MPTPRTLEEEREQLNKALALSLEAKKDEESYQMNMDLAVALSLQEDKPQPSPSNGVYVPKVSVSGEDYCFWLSEYSSQADWKAEGRKEGGQLLLTKKVHNKLESLGWNIVKVPGDGNCFGHAVGYYEGKDGMYVRRALKKIYDSGRVTPFVPDKDKKTILERSRWLSHGEIDLFCEDSGLELVIFDTFSGQTNVVNRGGGGRRIYVIRVNDNHYNVALPPQS